MAMSYLSTPKKRPGFEYAEEEDWVLDESSETSVTLRLAKWKHQHRHWR